MPLPARKGGVDPTGIPLPMRDAIGEIDKFGEDAQRRLVQHYLASISLVDEAIGSLIETLRDTGQLAHTLIVFVADHGEFLGQHTLLRKPSIHYDEVIRVPLLMRLPGGVGAGRQVDGLVELVDILPTLLGLAGLPQHPGMQGVDWSAALQTGGDIGRQDIYSDMYSLNPMTHGQAHGPYGACLTLRSATWKLNLYPDAGPAYGQLFHLAEDPDEAHNLYALPAYREQREAMLYRLLQRHHQQVNSLPLRLTQY
jgi:arylsulfatase